MHISSDNILLDRSLLRQLHHVTLALVQREKRDLTARQFAVFLCVYLGDGPHTARALAQELGVGKPAISRALDRLGEFDLARRRVDPMDRRRVFVLPTPVGWEFLAELRAAMGAAQFGDAASAAVATEIAERLWAEAGRPPNDAPRRDGPLAPCSVRDGAAFNVAAPHRWFRGGPALRLPTEGSPTADGTAEDRSESGRAGPFRRRANA